MALTPPPDNHRKKGFCKSLASKNRGKKVSILFLLLGGRVFFSSLPPLLHNTLLDTHKMAALRAASTWSAALRPRGAPRASLVARRASSPRPPSAASTSLPTFFKSSSSTSFSPPRGGALPIFAGLPGRWLPVPQRRGFSTPAAAAAGAESPTTLDPNSFEVRTPTHLPPKDSTKAEWAPYE
jgi:hypothetical protein